METDWEMINMESISNANNLYNQLSTLPSYISATIFKVTATQISINTAIQVRDLVQESKRRFQFNITVNKLPYSFSDSTEITTSFGMDMGEIGMVSLSPDATFQAIIRTVGGNSEKKRFVEVIVYFDIL